VPQVMQGVTLRWPSMRYSYVSFRHRANPYQCPWTVSSKFGRQRDRKGCDMDKPECDARLDDLAW